jgi:hypothetical protein
MAFRHLVPILATAIAALPLFGRWSDAHSQARVSGPVIADNVALFFVHGPSAEGPVPATLEEALAKGTVVVHETGRVDELTIENKGSEPVFVQIGDIVKGGRQDRVLTASLLLQPGTKPTNVGAFCVEQGRWAARGTEDATRFAASESLMPSRQAKVALARKAAPQPAVPGANGAAPGMEPASTPEPNVARAVEARQQRRLPRDDGQGEVWRSVGVMQMMLSRSLDADVKSADSATSLQLSLENERLRAAQAKATEAILPAGLAADDVVGVIVAVDGRFSAADVYASNGLFRKMWPKLARAAAVEGLAAKSDVVRGPVPSRAAAETFLAETEGGAATEARRPIEGAGVVIGREGKASLSVELQTEGKPVHRNYVAK